MSGPQKTTIHKLASTAYDDLKSQGRFFVNVSTYTHLLDVAQHVAAQNAAGWSHDGNKYVPVGNAPAAIVLRNIGFVLNKTDFVPQ